jgi:hypothetical protein
VRHALPPPARRRCVQSRFSRVAMLTQTSAKDSSIRPQTDGCPLLGALRRKVQPIRRRLMLLRPRSRACDGTFFRSSNDYISFHVQPNRGLKEWSDIPRSLAGKLINFEYNPNAAPTERCPSGPSGGNSGSCDSSVMRAHISWLGTLGRSSKPS